MVCHVFCLLNIITNGTLSAQPKGEKITIAGVPQLVCMIKMKNGDFVQIQVQNHFNFYILRTSYIFIIILC